MLFLMTQNVFFINHDAFFSEGSKEEKALTNYLFIELRLLLANYTSTSSLRTFARHV